VRLVIVRSHPLLLALRCLVLLGALGSSAVAQTIETHARAGLRFPRPQAYVQIPVPPLQTYVVLRYMDKPPSGRESALYARKQVLFVSLDESDGSAEQRWEKLWEWLPRLGLKPSIWGSPEDGVRKWENRHGQTVRKFEVESAVSTRDPVWVLHEPDRTLAIIGVGFGPGVFRLDGDEEVSEEEREYEGWAFAIDELRLITPEPPDLEKLARSHRRDGLGQPEYRAAVEASLVRGWKSTNTDHYIVIYNTGNEGFIRSIARELETLREEYARLFPPSGEMDRVSTVRICHDLSEYLAYGGPLSSGGFWSPAIRELVLFDNARRDGVTSWTNEDTRAVLYHEAFHQYIHDAVGELDPHMWFNEGLGDYFSGVRIKKGTITESEPVEERKTRIQRALSDELERAIPWGEFLLYDKAAFYDERRVELCYAQAWSMVYFLMTSPVVAADPQWSRILPVYFEVLKQAHAEEQEAGAAGAADRARARALEAAFGPVDLAQLARAWREFVRSL